MKNTHYDTYTISSYDVDPQGKSKLTAIANYLQETAYHHAHSLKLGYKHLAENNQAWILSRLKIKVHGYPHWDEEISIETWPHGIEKLFALRDFKISSSSGNLLAVASTCWLMVDMKSHRPVRINKDFIPIEVRTDAVFDRNPEKIKLPKTLRSCQMHKVKYSDLDIVGHVNNVKYIEWCSDAIDSNRMMERRIADFEINFLSEARIDDEIEILCHEDEKGNILLQGKHHEGGKECFRAKVKFLPGP